MIALQLHAGPPMKAEFKDLRIKLEADGGKDGANTGAIEDVTGRYQVLPDSSTISASKRSPPARRRSAK